MRTTSNLSKLRTYRKKERIIPRDDPITVVKYADENEKILMNLISNLSRFVKKEWDSKDSKDKLEKIIEKYQSLAGKLYKERHNKK